MNRPIKTPEDVILVSIFFIGVFVAYFLAKVIDKKMSNQFKQIYVKILLSIGSIIFILSFLFYLYIIIAYNHESANSNLWALMGIIGGLTIAEFGAIFTVVGHFSTLKPIRYFLKQTNYEEFSNYLKERIGLFQFESESSKENLNVYKKQIKKKIYYVIDIRIDELTNDNFEELYHNQIFPIIEDDFYQVKEKKQYKLNVTLIISVNRITSMFNQFIKSEERDKRYYKFPVGISFGSNQLYLPGIDTFRAQPCKSLRKQIKDILELED